MFLTILLQQEKQKEPENNNSRKRINTIGPNYIKTFTSEKTNEYLGKIMDHGVAY